MKKLLIAVVAGFMSVAFSGAYAADAMKKDAPTAPAKAEAKAEAKAAKAEAKAEATADAPKKTRRAARAEKN